MFKHQCKFVKESIIMHIIKHFFFSEYSFMHKVSEFPLLKHLVSAKINMTFFK